MELALAIALLAVIWIFLISPPLFGGRGTTYFEDLETGLLWNAVIAILALAAYGVYWAVNVILAFL